MVSATALSMCVMHNGTHYCFLSFSVLLPLKSSSVALSMGEDLWVFSDQQNATIFPRKSVWEGKWCGTLLWKELEQRKKVSDFYYSLNTSKSVCTSLCWQQETNFSLKCRCSWYFLLWAIEWHCRVSLFWSNKLGSAPVWTTVFALGWVLVRGCDAHLVCSFLLWEWL